MEMKETTWGPWIQHCGTKKPDLSRVMQVELPAGERMEIGGSGEERLYVAPPYAGPKYMSSWVWWLPGPCVPVIRYRYRRPPALQALVDLAANPPALAEAANVDAA